MDSEKIDRRHVLASMTAAAAVIALPRAAAALTQTAAHTSQEISMTTMTFTKK